MHRQVPPPSPALVHIPEVRKLGEERARDILDGPVAEVGEEVEDYREEKEGVGGEEDGEEHCG